MAGETTLVAEFGGGGEEKELVNVAICQWVNVLVGYEVFLWFWCDGLFMNGL